MKIRTRLRNPATVVEHRSPEGITTQRFAADREQSFQAFWRDLLRQRALHRKHRIQYRITQRIQTED